MCSNPLPRPGQGLGIPVRIRATDQAEFLTDGITPAICLSSDKIVLLLHVTLEETGKIRKVS